MIRFRFHRCIPLLGLLTASLLTMVFAAAGCDRSGPVRVGFSGCMSGRLSDLGIAGRNGVILATEELNAAGGLNGRTVKLLTRDDHQDPETAVRSDRELIEQGVVAIIGHMTSAMTHAALPQLNREGIPMISPTATSNRLNGLDDSLIRVMPPNRAETDHLARHAFHNLGLRRMAVLYDLSNRAYSEDYFENFKSSFETLGGRIVHVDRFTSGPGTDFSELGAGLLRPGLDGLLLVAGGMDTAMICQYVRMYGIDLPVISSGWAMTKDLLHHGGRTVEGLVFSHLMNQDSREDRFIAFRRRFRERFGEEPDFAAAHGYEAARMLFRGLQTTKDPKPLKQAILAQDSFFGVQGDFSLDRFGDPKRDRFLTRVRNGEFKALE
ncbi:MAG: ABC transporter substrate-binding protein [Deltaproteobacteria bacterium]|nr:ABC transporter substrate-binding protein [Deltaproteobacteria bacterium]